MIEGKDLNSPLYMWLSNCPSTIKSCSYSLFIILDISVEKLVDHKYRIYFGSHNSIPLIYMCILKPYHTV